MKVISVNVGLPREVTYKGRSVMTGIFKEPVSGRLAVRKLNLDGDAQADLSVHGGVDKAVYIYPSEHYGYWKGELEGLEIPGMELSWGVFGENLTTEGLLEEEIRVGDRLKVGTAEMVVTQPRLPCFKLGIRFGQPKMVRRFLAVGRPGFYCSVAEEGDVGAGDPVELLSSDPARPTVVEDFLQRLKREPYE